MRMTSEDHDTETAILMLKFIFDHRNKSHLKICSNRKQLCLVKILHNITAFAVFWIQ